MTKREMLKQALSNILGADVFKALTTCSSHRGGAIDDTLLKMAAVEVFVNPGRFSESDVGVVRETLQYLQLTGKMPPIDGE